MCYDVTNYEPSLNWYLVGSRISWSVAAARPPDGPRRPRIHTETRVLPTRSNPNRLFAAERGRTGVTGNTGSLGLLYSAETAETAIDAETAEDVKCSTHPCNRNHALWASQWVPKIHS
jgi:hypothetical protein